MEKQKKFGLSAWAVLAVLFLVGAVTAYVADNASGNMAKAVRGNIMGMWGGLGMHGTQNLSDLNLPANATKEQVREAVKEKTLEQLGLPSNATDAQIRNAMQEKANETQSQIDAAITSGNYDVWKALMEQNPRGAQLTTIITEDKFPKYAELYQAEKNVKTLSEELGLTGMKMGGGNFRGGFGRGHMAGNNITLPAPSANQ